MISNNIMKTSEFDDAIYYRAACACGSDDHDITIEFEKEGKTSSMIFLNFYKNIAWSSHWGDLNWFQRVWKRCKASMKILFTGYIELNESFIIEGEDHIDSIIQALKEGKEYIKRDKTSVIRGFSKKKSLKVNAIPKGDYCYDENGLCPYWSLRADKPYQESGYCSYLEKGDWELNDEKGWRNSKTGTIQTAHEIGLPMSLLWDQCKECDINKN